MGMEESDYDPDFAEMSPEEAQSRLAEIMVDNIQFEARVTKLKETIDRLELECKKYITALDEWQQCYKQQTEVIAAQSDEIRKLKEDYNKEMASMDQIMEDNDKQMLSLYQMVDDLKTQLQAERLSKIDLRREIEYLQQFKPIPKPKLLD